MATLTGASAILCAAHQDAAGRMHGHTYEITAWWLWDGSDVLDRQRQLVSAILPLDHGVLPDGLASAEEIARHIGMELRCQEVQVWRAGERLGARWSAA